MAPKSRLGWLGPAVVILGLVVGSIGVWVIYKNKPRNGPLIDTIEVDPNTKIIIRAEANGPNAFAELIEGGELKWQSLIPPYAGRKGRVGVAVTETAVAVRVVRGDQAELFCLARANGTKLGGVHLGLGHTNLKLDGDGPLQFSDARRTYEIVAGDGWNQVVAVDLTLGNPLWKQDLGPAPVTAGGMTGGNLWLVQGGLKRWFNVFSGKEDRSMTRTGKTFEELEREAQGGPLPAPKSP